MSAQSGEAPPPRTAPLPALAVTLTVQALAAYCLAVPSVLAPAVASDFGMQAQHVGWLVSIAYFAAMMGGLLCGTLSRRYGPVRMSQIALLAGAISMSLFALANPWVLLFSALLLGVGYGVPNPTAADILSRHAPPARRGLFFSIKQTGVPLGVALTGLLMPMLLAFMHWKSAVILMSGVLLLAMFAIGLARRTLDAGRAGAPPPAGAGSGGAASGGAAGPMPSADSGGQASAAPSPRPTVVALFRSHFLLPLRGVLSNRKVRTLALASLAFACTQVTYLSFLVSLLKLEHGMSLALAAGLLSASQLMSVMARIGWGYVSDRWVDPGKVLGLLGLGMAISILVLGLVPADAPWPVMLAIALACAATAVAWNGVYYADLVRHVPPAEVASATGATQFLTFLGGMSGAAGFAGLVSLAGNYSIAFALTAALPALSGVVLLREARRERLARQG